MRKIRCLAVGQRRERVVIGLILVSGLVFAAPGCHQHYHYYNTTDPCAPGAVVPSTVRASSAPCDSTTSIVDGGTTVADTSTRSTTVTGGQSRSPRVVTSNPDSSSSRFSSWKRSDSDGLAQTSVSGSLDDSKVNR
jgi:hypothetical protein